MVSEMCTKEFVTDTTESQASQDNQGSTALTELVNGLSRLDDSGKRREHAYNHLKKLTPDAAIELFENVAEQSLKWEAEHAIFVLLIDQVSIHRRLGKNGYKNYWSKLLNSSVQA
ncbi:hypothetical protein K8T06_13145 [bacterium]|nr:hypothetical protein [bacterium]